MSLINDFLRSMYMRKGSDLHVIAGDPPRMRVHGDLITLDNQRLDPEELRSELFDIMTPQSIEQFNKHDSADFAHSIPEVARFRVNVFRHLNGVGAVFRGIPSKCLTLDELKMPKALHELATATRGLILVTGKTGLGQVDDARSRHRRDQRQDQGPHPHDRRPDRVRASAQALPHEPARDRRSQRRASRMPCTRLCAKTPTRSSSASFGTSRR